MVLSAALRPSSYAKAVHKAASITGYAVLGGVMASWVASLVRSRLQPPPKERGTVVIKHGAGGRRHFDEASNNGLYEEVREYLATRIDPHSMDRFCLSGGGARKVMSMEHGGSMTDVFEGVEFTWAYVKWESKSGSGTGYNNGNGTESLELSFDVEHTDMALGRYIPFITAAVEEVRRQHFALEIFMNEGSKWQGINHDHSATFDTLAVDPEVKQSIVVDLDRFLKRKDYYKRIGLVWKRGYLLYGPPGTGKSNLVAAIANYLCFNLYYLDLSKVRCKSMLHSLLIDMPDKCILVIKDIDCCFTGHISLKGMLNSIDTLTSMSDEARIIIFTTDYKDRLDPALIRPGRINMHIYMGYCGWEAFKTLVQKYHLIDDHPLFLEIQELLSAVQVAPPKVLDMLLKSEDVDVALQVLADFLRGKKQEMQKGD